MYNKYKRIKMQVDSHITPVAIVHIHLLQLERLTCTYEFPLMTCFCEFLKRASIIFWSAEKPHLLFEESTLNIEPKWYITTSRLNGISAHHSPDQKQSIKKRLIKQTV